jgi:hypothetical protein
VSLTPLPHGRKPVLFAAHIARFGQGVAQGAIEMFDVGVRFGQADRVGLVLGAELPQERVAALNRRQEERELFEEHPGGHSVGIPCLSIARVRCPNLVPLATMSAAVGRKSPRHNVAFKYLDRSVSNYISKKSAANFGSCGYSSGPKG